MQDKIPPLEMKMSQDFHLAKWNTLLLRGGVKLNVGGLLDQRFSGDKILCRDMTIVLYFLFGTC